MSKTPCQKRRRVDCHVVEVLTRQIEEQQHEIDQLRTYKRKYYGLKESSRYKPNLTIEIPDYTPEEWSPVSPSYSGVSPQAENYPDAPFGYRYSWDEQCQWKLEAHDNEAKMIQKLWRGYKVRKSICIHSWIIERGMYGDHTIKYCVKCGDEDGCP